MNDPCARCGVGRRGPTGVCDWCAAPSRARLPLWAVARRRLLRAPGVGALRRRGAIVTGIAAGVAVHLLAAAVGVAFGIPGLWQAGFFWSQQWWWALVPEAGQPWLFAAARGAAYGVLAGWVAGRRSGEDAPTGRRDGGAASESGGKAVDLRDWIGPRIRLLLASPAMATALAAFVVSMAEVLLGWNSEVGLQYSLIAAMLGGAVGRLTKLITRGHRVGDWLLMRAGRGG